MIRITPAELRGNGLEQLITLSESKLVTRRFKNKLKSCGIYRPAYIDKAILVRGKLERRFDINLSNRKYKHRFVKSGGDIRQLKTLPRFEFKPVVAYRDESRGGALRRAHPRLPGAVAEKTKRSSRSRRVLPSGPVWSPQDDHLPLKARALLSTPSTRPLGVVARGTGETLYVLGGCAVPFAPAQAHLKYWYFLRKKGFWTPSRHHPHRDDTVIYNFVPLIEDVD